MARDAAGSCTCRAEQGVGAGRVGGKAVGEVAVAELGLGEALEVLLSEEGVGDLEGRAAAERVVGERVGEERVVLPRLLPLPPLRQASPLASSSSLVMVLTSLKNSCSGFAPAAQIATARRSSNTSRLITRLHAVPQWHVGGRPDRTRRCLRPGRPRPAPSGAWRWWRRHRRRRQSRQASPSASAMARRRRSLSKPSGMKRWPPKPGLTVITRTKSHEGHTSSTVARAVAG